MARSAADIESDLAAFYALRVQAATRGFAEYTFDSGQGRQSAKSFTLSEINQTIRTLEAELLDAQSGGGGPGRIVFDRGGC